MARRYLDGEWINWAGAHPFERAWITWAGQDGVAPVPPLADLEIAIGVDPAISQRDDSGYSALVVAGQHVEPDGGRGSLYVLDCERGHWSVYDTIDHLLLDAREKRQGCARQK